MGKVTVALAPHMRRRRGFPGVDEMQQVRLLLWSEQDRRLPLAELAID